MSEDCLKTLSRAPQGKGRMASLRQCYCQCVPLGHADRLEAERYIHNVYAQTYGAQVESYYPDLMLFRSELGIRAAVGVRGAREPFFLEQYLDTVIEQAISGLAHRPIDRSRLVEIGNLVATQRGGSFLAFSVLAAALARTRTEWMVFTATPQVSKIIRKMGLTLHALGPALPNRLSDGADKWGSYYACSPQVMVADMADVRSILKMQANLRAWLTPHEQDIRHFAKGFQEVNDVLH